jgi:cytochrome c oxidase subunit 4
MLLAVITGIEIVAVFLPFATWLLFSALAIFSLVKFMFVIFYFMHLRWDKAFCTVMFFIGLVLATGTTWALIHLFEVKDSVPLSSISYAPAPAAIPASNLA